MKKSNVKSNSSSSKSNVGNTKKASPKKVLNTFEEIPKAKSEAKKIVGVTRSSGKIDGYHLSDGKVVSKEQGIKLARKGGIDGVGIASRNGSEYLKTLPNSKSSLSEMPTYRT